MCQFESYPNFKSGQIWPVLRDYQSWNGGLFSKKVLPSSEYNRAHGQRIVTKQTHNPGKWHWRFTDSAETFLQELLQHFEKLEYFTDAEVLKSSLSRTVIAFPSTSSRPGLITKRYNVRGSKEILKYFFLKSRAFSEWRALKHLKTANVAVPRPLAFGEKRSGKILLGAGLVMEKLANAQGISQWLRERGAGHLERVEVLRQVGYQVAGLHGAGCRHSDLHVGNILVQYGGPDDKLRVVLIDHHVCRIGKMPSERQRRNNLAKLLHSLLPKITHSESMELLRAYNEAGEAPRWDPSMLQRVLNDLVYRAYRLQEIRLRSRSKRCWKNSSQFARTYSKGWRVYRRREIPLDALHIFQKRQATFEANPQDRQGIGISDETLKIGDGAQPVSVMQYRRKGLWERIWHRIHRGPLEREWGAARAREVKGISGSRALALMILYRFGLPDRSIMITEPVDRKTPSRHLFKGIYGTSPAISGTERPYHIARIITWLPRGGIERRLVALLPRLNKSPFRVSLVCIRERGPLADELRQAGVAVSVIPLRSRLDPHGLRALSQWMHEQRVDLVHSHMYRSNVPATIAARRAGVRHVLCQVHNIDTWETRRQRMLDRWLMRWRTAMLAVSNNVKHDIVATLGCPPRQVRVLYNGININEYGSVHPNPQLRHALGIPEGNKLVVVLARLVEQKKHTRLLQALETIHNELPPVSVLFVGDGKLRGELEREVETRHLGDMVSFTGHRNDIPQILSLSDLSVLTSDREGFSNTIIESLAAGVPVVATDVGGNSEAIVDGECGLIIKPDDLTGLAKALKKVLADNTLRRKMSQAARMRAQHFSLENMLDETRRLYLELLTKNR